MTSEFVEIPIGLGTTGARFLNEVPSGKGIGMFADTRSDGVVGRCILHEQQCIPVPIAQLPGREFSPKVVNHALGAIEL
jgi:hypothetical protein